MYTFLHSKLFLFVTFDKMKSFDIVQSIFSFETLFCFILASLYIYDSSEAADSSFQGIPGSQVKTEGGTKSLRGCMSCVAKHGRWEIDSSPRKLPWIRESYGRSSRCESESGQTQGLEGFEADVAASKGEGWNVNPEILWKFTVDECPWEKKLDYGQFCRAMGSAYGKNASILIFGDNFSYAFERRFFYNMLSSAPSFSPYVVNLFPEGCPAWDGGKENRYCTGYRYCYDILGGDSVAVRFIRTHNLSLSRDATEDSLPWITTMSHFKPTVVVFNHAPLNMDAGIFEDNVISALQWSRKHYPDTLMYYRSTPTAPDCNANQPSVPIQVINQQNSIARDIVEHFGGLFLDINPPWDSRPDALVDISQSKGCIRICQPGLMDAWIQLFYNSLMVALPPVNTNSSSSSSLSSTITTSTLTITKDTTLLTTETKSTAVMQWKSRKIGGELPAADSKEAKEALSIPEKGSYNMTVDRFIRNTPEAPVKLSSVIPGSPKVYSLEKLNAVKAKLHCFTNKGEWVYDPTPRPKAWEIAPLADVSKCDARHVAAGGLTGAEADRVAAQGGNWSVREEIKWEWETKEEEQCPLETFSKEKFCRSLGPGRSVLMLGDSINYAFARHLFAHIFREMDYDEYPPINLFPDRISEWNVGLRRDFCIGFAVCHDVLSQPVEIRFCFNRRLSLAEVPLEGEAPWVTKLSEWKPSVFFLNRGAHYFPDDVFEGELRDSLRYLRSELPEALIIWRNTPPGHVDCMNYTSPLKTRQDPAILPDAYHWGSFSIQNKIAEKLVEEIGGIYMDVDHFTSLRPDGHCGVNGAGRADCLHYCQPGPQDTWVKVLHNFLQVLL